MVPDGHLRSLEAQNQRLRDLAEAEGWILADLALLSETLTPHYEDAIHVTMDGERIKAQGVVDALTEPGCLAWDNRGRSRQTKRLRDRGLDARGDLMQGRLEHISWCRHDLVGLVDVALGDGTCRVAAAHRGEGRCGAFILADGHRNGAEGLHDHGGSDADGADGLARRVEGLEDALSVAVDAAV